MKNVTKEATAFSNGSAAESVKSALIKLRSLQASQHDKQEIDDILNQLLVNLTGDASAADVPEEETGKDSGSGTDGGTTGVVGPVSSEEEIAGAIGDPAIPGQNAGVAENGKSTENQKGSVQAPVKTAAKKSDTKAPAKSKTAAKK